MTYHLINNDHPTKPYAVAVYDEQGQEVRRHTFMRFHNAEKLIDTLAISGAKTFIQADLIGAGGLLNLG